MWRAGGATGCVAFFGAAFFAFTGATTTVPVTFSGSENLTTGPGAGTAALAAGAAMTIFVRGSTAAVTPELVMATPSRALPYHSFRISTPVSTRKATLKVSAPSGGSYGPNGPSFGPAGPGQTARCALRAGVVRAAAVRLDPDRQGIDDVAVGGEEAGVAGLELDHLV